MQVKVVLRADISPATYDKVVVISGGSSGHEPAHSGFVGEGMLAAAICGDVFASPPVDAVLAGIRAVTGPIGKKEPTWNEEFTFNIKLPSTKNLQVAAWDANLVTPHKRMGNAGICLELLCDGDSHEMVVELEGMGGGGKIQLEVRYKIFDEIDEGKKWWKLPFVSEFLRQNGFESTLKSIVGSDSVRARQFVEYAFGQLKSFNETYPWKDKLLNSGKYVAEGESVNATAAPEKSSSVDVPLLNDQRLNEENIVVESSPDSTGFENANGEKMLVGESIQFDKHFWKNFADVINQKVVQKLGLPVPENVKWDGFDVLNKIGIQSRKVAEKAYVESGLATPSRQDIDDSAESGPLLRSAIQSSIPDIKKVTQDLLQQTDSVLGALMVLTAAVSRLNKEARSMEKNDNKMKSDDSVYSKSENLAVSSDVSSLDEKKSEEMKTLFSSAESAMEAWALLATSLGHPSFVKSEFEKICFLDNASTDTQGKKCTAYPVVKLDVVLAGATWLEPDPIDRCFTDGNLVTGAAWPGHPEFIFQLMALLGIKSEERMRKEMERFDHEIRKEEERLMREQQREERLLREQRRESERQE
ncbi:hypothetical protein ACJRO7_030696 [Eucalyptus globulus]|uniref:C2 domain-containing protein n=1 Tax=Eucalyptus globulus TaxID=34317 RepID=A0ABD3JJS5_EUCGL